jgi:hypothetical protein
MDQPSHTRQITCRAARFVRLSAMSGWRLLTGVLGVGLVGLVTWATDVSALWVVVALFGALFFGAYFAWDDVERRGAAADANAKRADLLQQQLTLKAKELAVSQAQYRVFENFPRRGQ